MKKFSFSMEKILDIRTFEKKQAESELSMAMMKEREIQAQIDSFTKKRALCVIDAEKSTDFSVIVNSQKYLKFIEKKNGRTFSGTCPGTDCIRRKKGSFKRMY